MPKTSNNHKSQDWVNRQQNIRRKVVRKEKEERWYEPAHVVPKDSLMWTTCSLHIFEVAVHTIIVSGVLRSLVVTIVLVTMLLFEAL